MHHFNLRTKSGFTLIELLVVIAIIGILASVVLSSLGGARASARDSQRIQMIKQLQTALELYRGVNGIYPSTGAGVNASWRGGTAGCAGGYGFGATGYIPGLVPTYISVLPADPKPGTGSQCLLYSSSGTEYKILFFNTMEACLPGSCLLQDPARVTSSVGRSASIYTPGVRNW